jgi:uncharacterized protein (TIGR02246 family)
MQTSSLRPIPIRARTAITLHPRRLTGLSAVSFALRPAIAEFQGETVRALVTLALLTWLAVSTDQAPAAEPAAAPPPTTGLFVKFRVKQGSNAAFEAAFRKMQASMGAHEPGNVYYDLFVTPENPQLYVIMERYQDAAAVTAHNNSDHIKTVLAEMRPLLDGPIEPQRLIFVSTKPTAAADTKQDVEAATAQWISAFNRKSVADIVALYANDAVFFGTTSPVLRDSPDLVQDYFKSLPTLGDSTISVGDHRVQLFGDVAINTGVYTRTSTQDGKVVQNPARFTFVYQKRQGKWLIVEHHSSVMPGT